MKELLLSDGDFNLMQIIWDNAPLESGKLVKLCAEEFDWKKSTTYTMLKRLCEKGMVENENSVIKVLVSREEIQKVESDYLIEKSFAGSLPAFMSAFLDNGKISKKEAKKLIDLIEEHIDE